MKVLICVRRLDIGGAEMLECRLASQLNKLGVETHLLAQYSAKEFSGAACAIQWRKSGIPQVHFLNSSGSLSVFHSLYNFYKLVRKYQYDVVITSNTGLDTITGIIKLIVTYKHIIAFHTYVSPAILNTIRIKGWLFFVARADAYYSITNYVKKNIDLILKSTASRNRTIYNSLDEQKIVETEEPVLFSIRQQLGISKDATIILLAGRIESRKGFDIAIKYLRQIINSENSYVVIVGDKYEGGAIENGLIGFSFQLTKEIELMGIEDKVLYTGYRKDLFQIMRQSSVYVHLARHEGFGLVLLEAIAAGLPVVASDAGGIPEVLERTPYKVFPLNDETGIVKEVTRILAMDKEQRKQMTEKAKSVLSFYTDRRRAQEVLNLITDMKK